MKRSIVILCVAIILISVVFAGCRGAEGGKVTDRDDTPDLSGFETEISSMADMVTDIMPDMTGNISDTQTAM